MAIRFGVGDAPVFRTDADATIHVVPEPATLSLLGSGGLAFVRRRRT